jgi:[ribosomal protein S5]-alanine N-acetyltransferase
MEIIRTSRLILRTWTTADLPFGNLLWGDPLVMKYVGSTLSSEQVLKSIEAGIKHQERFGYQHWAVIEIETEKLIGACGFNKTDTPDEIEIVFHLSKQVWGQGYATEAAKACIEFAFEHIRPKKIIAGCHPQNEASKKVLVKIGFSFIGNKWFEDTQREEPFFELVR